MVIDGRCIVIDEPPIHRFEVKSFEAILSTLLSVGLKCNRIRLSLASFSFRIASHGCKMEYLPYCANAEV